MGLYGGGANAKYWRSPTSRMPAGGGRPIWVSVWTRGPVPARNNGLATFANTGGTASAGIYIGSSGTTYAWDQNDAAALAQAVGTGAAVANTWQHFLSYHPSMGLRFIYLNSVQLSQEGTTLALPQTLDTFTVGGLQLGGANYADTNRLIAEAVFGQGVLELTQMQKLAQGQSPLAVLPGQILAYFPLRGDLRDLGPRQAGLMPMGGVANIWGEHPPVALPPRRLIAFKAGAPSSIATGTSDGTSTASGVGIALAPSIGTVTGTSTASGVGFSSSTSNSVATAVGTSAAPGVGRATGNSIATSAGVGAASGVGSTAASSTSVGTSVGTSTATGIGRETATSVGTATGIAAGTGVGNAAIPSVATAAGTSTATALTGAATTITGVGTSAGSSSANAVARSSNTAVYTSVGTSTASGVTQQTSTSPSVGTATGASTATATGISKATSSATATGASTAAATSSFVTGFASVGTAAGTSTANAVAKLVASSVGTATSLSTANGAGNANLPRVGTAAGTSTANAITGAGNNSIGTITGTSTAPGVGASITEVQSTGAAPGVSTTIGVARGFGIAVGTADSTSTASGLSGAGSNAKGTAAGISTATGFTDKLFGPSVADGIAVGTSTATGVSKIISASIGTAPGTSTAIAFNPYRPSVGTSTGSSTAIGRPPTVVVRNFYKQLYDLISPVTSQMSPPLPLIFSHQNVPRGNKPMAMLRVDSIRIPQHENYWEVDENGWQNFASYRQATVDLSVFGHGAGNTVRWIAQALRSETSLQRAQKLDISIGTRLMLTEVPSLLNGSQYEERGIYQFVVNFTEDMDDDVSLIEEVIVDGTFTGGATGDVLKIHIDIDSRAQEG